jgi:hypothetical protein
MQFKYYGYLSVAGILLSLAGCADVPTSTPEPLTAVAGQPATAASGSQSVPANVTFKNVTLSRLDLNQSGDQVTVKPGSVINATVHYKYQCSQCYKTLNNQIIVGLANRSAQACIYDGGMQGEGVAQFKLKAPAKPGKYEVRFRGLQSVDCNAALKAGWTADDSPSKATTVGVITASRKA